MADAKIRALQERYKKIKPKRPHEMVEPDAETSRARIGKYDYPGAGRPRSARWPAIESRGAHYKAGFSRRRDDANWLKDYAARKWGEQRYPAYI